MSWNKRELEKLLYREKLTPSEIADLKGISRQRVSQKMKEFGFERDKTNRKCRGKWFNVNSLESYFNQVRKTREEAVWILRKYVFPRKCKCGEKVTIIHFLRHPAQSLKDLQFWCRSCCYAQTRKTLGFKEQTEICNKYHSGETVKKIAQEYNCSIMNIYRIIRRRRDG